MTERIHGHVTAITKEIRGDELAAAVTAGATSLTVVDAVDFDERGGSLRLGMAVHTYAAADMDTGVISGISPTLAAASEGDRVDVWSVVAGDVVAEWIAEVTDDDDGAAIECPVSHSLVDLLKGGIRGLNGESVVCVLEENGEWVVDRMLGQATSTSTGMVLQTDDEGNRIVVRSLGATGARAEFYTGDADETQPGYIASQSLFGQGQLLIQCPTFVDSTPSAPRISMGHDGDFPTASIELRATDVEVEGNLDIDGTLHLPDSDTLTSIRTGRKDSGTTDASSDVTVTHNLGATPTSVTLGPASNHHYSVVALSSTTFTLRVRTSAGVLVGSGVTPDVFWTAIKV